MPLRSNRAPPAACPGSRGLPATLDLRWEISRAIWSVTSTSVENRACVPTAAAAFRSHSVGAHRWSCTSVGPSDSGPPVASRESLIEPYLWASDMVAWTFASDQLITCSHGSSPRWYRIVRCPANTGCPRGVDRGDNTREQVVEDAGWNLEGAEQSLRVAKFEKFRRNGSSHQSRDDLAFSLCCHSNPRSFEDTRVRRHYSTVIQSLTYPHALSFRGSGRPAGCRVTLASRKPYF